MVWWEQLGSCRGFLGYQACSFHEFPSALIGLVLPLGTRKAQGNLPCRCFLDCICLAHIEILLYFSMIPLQSGGKGTLASIRATQSIFLGLYMQRYKGDTMVSVYFHLVSYTSFFLLWESSKVKCHMQEHMPRLGWLGEQGKAPATCAGLPKISLCLFMTFVPYRQSSCHVRGWLQWKFQEKIKSGWNSVFKKYNCMHNKAMASKWLSCKG